MELKSIKNLKNPFEGFGQWKLKTKVKTTK